MWFSSPDRVGVILAQSAFRLFDHFLTAPRAMSGAKVQQQGVRKVIILKAPGKHRAQESQKNTANVSAEALGHAGFGTSWAKQAATAVLSKPVCFAALILGNVVFLLSIFRKIGRLPRKARDHSGSSPVYLAQKSALVWIVDSRKLSLLGTSATLVVTGTLLVVTRSY